MATAVRPIAIDERHAHRVGNRAAQALDWVPGLGASMGAQEGVQQARRGYRSGSLSDMLIGAGSAALSAAPGVGSKGGNALRGFHASPQSGLRHISAAPPQRQYDNATSQFGAYFSPNVEGARRYGPNVYEADLPLAKPYEMDWSEFARFQAPEKAADGSRVPAEHWGRRAAELKREAAAFRRKLEAHGYDGLIVRGPRGDVKEIASFRDVPLK